MLAKNTADQIQPFKGSLVSQPAIFSIAQLELVLADRLQCPVIIELNRNERSLIRIVKRSICNIHLSLHRIFLKAPEDILRALAGFIAGDKKARMILSHFAHTCAEKRAVTQVDLQSQGDHHDLDLIHYRMHQRYFPALCPLAVTWYAKVKTRSVRSVTLGLFDRSRQLIKVHRLLDHPEVPHFFVEFVLYHEALHRCYLPVMDERRGQLVVHTRAFKRAERAFEGYDKCRRWQRHHLFALLARARLER